MTHYEALGVATTATQDEIKAAFRAAAHECHPDHKPGDPTAAEKFMRVRDAYEVLSDPARRASYDATDLDLISLIAEVFR